MGISPLGQHIRLPDFASGKLQLRAGDVVSVNVIKELSSSIWAVGVKGVVFRATTGLTLTAGETLKALVVKIGAHLELKLIDSAQYPLEAILRTTGFAKDNLAVLIVSALVKWQMKIDERTVESLRQALGKLKGDPKRNARTLALLVAKGMAPGSRELPALAAVCDYGAGGGRRGRAEGKKPERESSRPLEEKIVEQLKDAVGAPLRRSGLLSLFNHIQPHAGGANWLVVPFSIGEPDSGFSGTMRFLYDAVSRAVKKTVIVAYAPGGERYQFSLTPSGEGYQLAVATDQARYIGKPLSHWREYLENLRRAGVQWAERIVSDGADEGFETGDHGGEYRSIDLEG